MAYIAYTLGQENSTKCFIGNYRVATVDFAVLLRGGLLTHCAPPFQCVQRCGHWRSSLRFDVHEGPRRTCRVSGNLVRSHVGCVGTSRIQGCPRRTGTFPCPIPSFASATDANDVVVLFFGL
jgi:hypothetical protein